MRFLNKFIACIIMVNFSLSFAMAGDDKSIAVGLVKKYIQKLNDSTESVALNSIRTKPASDNPKFSVMVYDFNGVIKAWSFIPSYEGKNITSIPDLSGKFVMVDIIKSIKQSPVGWFDFKAKNPYTGMQGNIKSYYEVFNNYIVACGYFE